MKKIFFVIIVLLGVMSSCTKNFEDFNTDKKRPVVVPAENLFANAQKALADQEASTNVNLNNFKLWAQYWTETTYTDEANYDIITRPVPDAAFRVYYRDVLSDLNDAKNIISASAPIGVIAEAEKANQLAIVDAMQVYTFAQLLEIFGNIPYSEALDITNIYPKYDDALTVYKALLTRLDADLSAMDDAYGSFGAADIYMGGDVAMWKKFANSMKVRIGITIADGDDATAKAAVESGYAGAFAPDEKCELVYLSTAIANPIYNDVIASGRHDFVIANTIIDAMSALEDPRMPSYFTELDGAYVGAPYGESAPYAAYSHIADPIVDPTYPSVILDGTEVAFYLAEAAARGYSVGGTAADYYNAAITSSFNTWGVGADADAYLAKPEVAYSSATGDWRQKIGIQAWIAYYVRGQVAWTTYRRLDWPALNIPPNALTTDELTPRRFTYPVQEQTLNKASFEAAVSAMGSDKMETKLFWDKY